MDEFIVYAQRYPCVVFVRKDKIARLALASPMTIRKEEFA
jgi:hypothetical protein